jgi:hypothetical protein
MTVSPVEQEPLDHDGQVRAKRASARESRQGGVIPLEQIEMSPLRKVSGFVRRKVAGTRDVVYHGA